MKRNLLTIFLILNCGFIFCQNLESVSELEALSVAQNWLALMNSDVDITISQKYYIRGIEPIFHDGELLCEIFHLNPSGHIIIPMYKEMPPIKSYSFMNDFISDSSGYEYSIIEELKRLYDFLISDNRIEISSLKTAIQDNKNHWLYFSSYSFNNIIPRTLELCNENIIQTKYLDDLGRAILRTTAAPLVKTKWNQSSPYWLYCPFQYGYRCYVGCTATAFAQTMRYFKWPDKGEGSHSYYWDGGRQYLFAYFSDEYDWDFMPLTTSDIDAYRERYAVAELCYEAGVAVNMEYSPTGSSASTSDVVEALKAHFKYSQNVKKVYRPSYQNVNEWFNLFKAERDAKRPVIFSMYSYAGSGHAVVLDGYQITGNFKQVHINMGWGGSYDAYYTLDNILSYNNNYLQEAVINIYPLWGMIQLNKRLISFQAKEGAGIPPKKYFKLRNSGKGKIDFQISGTNQWINPIRNTVSSSGEWKEVGVKMIHSGLIEGTYSGEVRITSEGAENSPQSIEINFKVLPPSLYFPLNFKGEKVLNRSLSQIEYLNVLTWEPNPKNLHIEKYRIYHVVDGNLSALEEVNKNTFTCFHRKREVDEINYYKIAAIDYKDRVSPLSDLIYVK